jgi:serpin B
MKKIIFTAIIGLPIALLSCSENVNEAKELSEPIRIDLSDTEFRLASEGKTFAWEFFSTAYEQFNEDENIVLSPLSLNMALAMTWNGANGETRQAIQKAMGMSDYSPSEVNEYFKKLREAILKTDPTTQLALANSIWYDNEFPVKPDFIQTNKTWYSADVKAIDFSSPDAPKQINNWCADNTNGLIKDMIGTIPPDVVVYLLNALYFKGTWANDFGFDSSGTRDVSFKKEKGETASVKMMSQNNRLYYYRNADFALTALPYGNHAFNMVFILPNENVSFDAALAKLKQPGYWETCLGSGTTAEVDLFIPKFKIEYEPKPNLNGTLTRLGMGIAFGNADFSGISSIPLSISQVRQKAVIEVNEQGTEAAAVTVVELAVTSLPPTTPEKVTFRADRPFLFAIQESSTGTILFMGKIGAPK